tara:strand:- start:201 stop:692 length:492 start_codon:yes stop_codon:yes gene_type:complete
MSTEKKPYPLTDIENITTILNKISIFAGLTKKQIETLFELLGKVRYGKDELIFSQGDPASHIYIVRKGKVKIYMEAEDTNLELIEFGVGECFGESALIGIEPHSASALAVQKTELIVLSGQALLSLYNSDRDIYIMVILNIAREVCRRLNKSDDILLHYALKK